MRPRDRAAATHAGPWSQSVRHRRGSMNYLREKVGKGETFLQVLNKMNHFCRSSGRTLPPPVSAPGQTIDTERLAGSKAIESR